MFIRNFLKTINKNLLQYSIVFLLLVSAVFLIVLIKQKVKPDEKRTLPISVQGKVTAVPNLAMLNLTIITEGGRADKVQEEGAKKMNSVLNFLENEGIKKEDVKTIDFNLRPKYYYPGDYPRIPCPRALSESGFSCPPNSPVIIGYRLDQTLQVKVRDFGKIGKIISQSVSRGVNQISNVWFTIEDIDQFKKQAREKAFEKAKEQARDLARLGGFKIKKILNVSEGQVLLPRPVPIRAEAMETGDAEVGLAKVEPGTQEVTVNLVVTFEIR